METNNYGEVICSKFVALTDEELIESNGGLIDAAIGAIGLGFVVIYYIGYGVGYLSR